MINQYFVNKSIRLGILLVISSWMYASVAMAQVKAVNTVQLKQFVEEGVAVVDVRTPSEWRATGVIPNSKLLTFFDYKGNYNLDAWLSKFKEFADPTNRVVIICQVGNRSAVIASFLYQQLGFTEVYNASGGIQDWSLQRGDIETWPSSTSD